MLNMTLKDDFKSVQFECVTIFFKKNFLYYLIFCYFLENSRNLYLRIDVNCKLVFRNFQNFYFSKQAQNFSTKLFERHILRECRFNGVGRRIKGRNCDSSRNRNRIELRGTGDESNSLIDITLSSMYVYIRRQGVRIEITRVYTF